MNYSKYRFNLDMQSFVSQVSLPVRQLDTGIVLRINLTEGGVPYTIKDGCRAVFFARKPDGLPLMNDCVIEKNSTICYELTQQTTVAPGIVDCEIRLYGSDGKLITTPRFILVVDSRVVHDEDFPLSEAEQAMLDNIIISEEERLANEEERKKTYEELLGAMKSTHLTNSRTAAGSFYKSSSKVVLALGFAPRIVFVTDADGLIQQTFFVDAKKGWREDKGSKNITALTCSLSGSMFEFTDTGTSTGNYHYVAIGNNTVTFKAVYYYQGYLFETTGTAAEGMTWAEFCEASFDSGYGDFVWQIRNGYVFFTPLEMYLFDTSGNLLKGDSVVLAGDYLMSSNLHNQMTFTVGGKSYTATIGVTWDEFTGDHINEFYTKETNPYGICKINGEMIGNPDYTGVSYEDFIIPGCDYVITGA